MEGLDFGVIDRALAAIMEQCIDLIAMFIPTGVSVLNYTIGLAVLAMGANIAAGGNLVPVLLRVAGAAACTRYAIEWWPAIVQQTMAACDQAMTMMVGHGGTAAMFSMALDMAGRIELETMSFAWSAPISSGIAVVVKQLVPLVVVFGLSLPAILAIAAKLQLVIGAVAAPLILPALAFGVTAPLGWGCVQFMLTQSVRVIVMGVLAHVFAFAIASEVALPGVGEPLTSEAVWVLAILAVVAAVFSWEANAIAGALVGGHLNAVDGALVREAVNRAKQAARSLGGAAAGGPAAAAGISPEIAGGVVGGLYGGAHRGPRPGCSGAAVPLCPTPSGGSGGAGVFA